MANPPRPNRPSSPFVELNLQPPTVAVQFNLSDPAQLADLVAMFRTGWFDIQANKELLPRIIRAITVNDPRYQPLLNALAPYFETDSSLLEIAKNQFDSAANDMERISQLNHFTFLYEAGIVVPDSDAYREVAERFSTEHIQAEWGYWLGGDDENKWIQAALASTLLDANANEFWRMMENLGGLSGRISDKTLKAILDSGLIGKDSGRAVDFFRALDESDPLPAMLFSVLDPAVTIPPEAGALVTIIAQSGRAVDAGQGLAG